MERRQFVLTAISAPFAPHLLAVGLDHWLGIPTPELQAETPIACEVPTKTTTFFNPQVSSQGEILVGLVDWDAEYISHGLTIISPDSNSSIRLPDVHGTAFWSPDGNNIMVKQENQISVYDKKGTNLGVLAQSARWMSIDPKTQDILYLDNNYDGTEQKVVIHRLSADAITHLAEKGAVDPADVLSDIEITGIPEVGYFTCAPENTLLDTTNEQNIYLAAADFQVYTAPVDGGDAQLFKFSASDTHYQELDDKGKQSPIISPSGDIAFVTNNGGSESWETYIYMPSKSKGPFTIGNFHGPAWLGDQLVAKSPDGGSDITDELFLFTFGETTFTQTQLTQRVLPRQVQVA